MTDIISLLWSMHILHAVILYLMTVDWIIIFDIILNPTIDISIYQFKST